MKIFLDVGGHLGETLDEVLKPNYRFDIIHCFEPQVECYEMLKNKYQDWVELHNFGLADFDDMRGLYGEGMGASLFADKQDIDDSQRAKCRFVRASSFIKEHVKQDDLAVMKLNCEGGEVLILRDLIQGASICYRT